MNKNTLYLTLGGKGGVGKTILATLLADYLKSNSIPFVAFDCDLENAGKAAAFSTAYPEAQRANLRSVADCDKLLSVAAEAPITLVDLPANASGDFMQWWESVATPETLEALNLGIVGLGSITPEAGSFASVAQWANALQDSMSYIVGLNHRTMQRVAIPKEELFREYFQSKVGKQFRQLLQPKEIEIFGLYDGSMALLARSGMLPSQAVVSATIPILDRSRIKTWTKRVHDQLSAILTP